MFHSLTLGLRTRCYFTLLAGAGCLLAITPPALAQSGQARVWGSYQHNNSDDGSSTIFPMTAPAGLSNVVALASGLENGLALQSDGRVVSWGCLLYTSPSPRD